MARVCLCLYGFASVQSWSFAVGASLPRQSFVSLHLCIDSHLCRCIVQRLCVAVFMHPCITALCGCLYASLHNGFVWLSLCILAYRLFATTCKHPCLKPLGVHFRHPCLACPPVTSTAFITASLVNSLPSA